ncbi:histone H1-like, partial [Simochromis diagramma]
ISGSIRTSLVAASKERSGVSAAALKKALAAGGYDVDKNKARVKTAIKSLVAKSTLVQTKGTGASGSFKMNKKATESKAKKPVKKTAPKAKKPTAAKAKKPAAAAKKPKKVLKKAPAQRSPPPRRPPSPKSRKRPQQPRRSELPPLSHSTTLFSEPPQQHTRAPSLHSITTLSFRIMSLLLKHTPPPFFSLHLHSCISIMVHIISVFTSLQLQKKTTIQILTQYLQSYLHSTRHHTTSCFTMRPYRTRNTPLKVITYILKYSVKKQQM